MVILEILVMTVMGLLIGGIIIMWPYFIKEWNSQDREFEQSMERLNSKPITEITYEEYDSLTGRAQEIYWKKIAEYNLEQRFKNHWKNRRSKKQ